MKNNTLSPLFLQSAVGPFTGVGAVGSAVPLEVYNPNNTAMLVDQIRFSKRTTDTLQQAFSRADLCAYAIELLLGSIPLTKRTVTLGALAPRYIGVNLTGPGAAVGEVGEPGLTWHLPRPLYVPPMVQLIINVSIQATNFLVADTARSALSVSVVGRSLPRDFPVPSEIDVPWVTETKCDQAMTRFVSSDNDLVNSNNVPLHLTQFVGTSYNGGNRVPTGLKVQMSLSNGTLLIRDQIPFLLAFPPDRGILPATSKLQPGMFARLELENNVAGADCQFSAVAMHGYRRIQTPGTLG